MKEATNFIEILACPGVISIARLLHFREFSLELADERQDTYAIHKHGERISLGDAFLSVKTFGCPIVALEYKCTPASVAIEYKPSPQWPLMLDSPQHGCLLLFVACIICINKQNTQIPFMLVQPPKVLHCKAVSFDACF